MIEVTVAYPADQGRTFNMDYYLKTHIPLFQKRMGAAPLRGVSPWNAPCSAKPGFGLFYTHRTFSPQRPRKGERALMEHLLKWPLIVTATVIVARVLLERFGAPPVVNNTLSVLLLTVVIFPMYFAARIAKSGKPHPYRTTLKTTALYALLARAMIIPTYWLAHIYQWPEPRFEGVVRPGITAFRAYILSPFNPAVFVASVVIGCVFASLVMALVRLFPKKASLVVNTH